MVAGGADARHPMNDPLPSPQPPPLPVIDTPDAALPDAGAPNAGPPHTAPSGHPGHRGPRWAGWAAAAVIALSVIVAVVQVAWEKASGSGAPDGRNAMSRLESEIEARYIVGMNAVLGPLLESSGQSKQPWLKRMEEAAAISPRQRLELDIVRREVFGPETLAEAPPADGKTDAEVAHDWKTWVALRSASPSGDDADADATPLDAAALDTASNADASNADAPDEAAISEDDRKRFEERYGWFARLALSHGLPDSDPLRAGVLEQSCRTLFGVLALVFGVFGSLAIGCALAIWACTRIASGRWTWRFDAVDRPVIAATGGSVWLETFAVYIAVLVLGGAGADLLPKSWTPWPQAMMFVGAAVVGVLWPVFRGLNRGERQAGFGWHAGRGVMREVAAGMAGYVAGLPLIALGVGFTLLLTLATKADASHPLNHLTGAPAPWLVALGLLAVVWAPLVEELFFRGAFLSAWRRKCSRWFSGLCIGVIFAAVHPQGWTAIPALGAVGLVLALLREWRSSIIAPMAAHALNNGTLFLVMLVIMR